jgi:hypothetical protein
MGTRAAILVFGFSEHGVRRRDGFAAVRLYQHWDGDPTVVLGELVAATRLADGFVREHARRMAERYERPPTVSDLPAVTFGGILKFAGLGIHGPGIRDDTDPVDPGNDRTGERSAVYHAAAGVGADAAGWWGNQGDLEWCYRVDLTTRAVTVYGGGYGTPAEHRRRGPVDPRGSALGLRDEESYRERAYAELGRRAAELRTLGWTVTPPRKPRAVRRLRALAYRTLALVLAELPADYRTEAVVGLYEGIVADAALDRSPVLADALEDAGCPDGALVEAVRALSPSV